MNDMACLPVLMGLSPARTQWADDLKWGDLAPEGFEADEPCARPESSL